MDGADLGEVSKVSEERFAVAAQPYLECDPANPLCTSIFDGIPGKSFWLSGSGKKSMSVISAKLFKIAI